MKKFLDPLANAQSMGWLYIFSGAIQLIRVIGAVANIHRVATIGDLLYFVVPTITITIGVGLQKKKLWALYAFIVTGFLSIFDFAILYTHMSLLAKCINIFFLLCFVILSLWFYSAKKRFIK